MVMVCGVHPRMLGLARYVREGVCIAEKDERYGRHVVGSTREAHYAESTIGYDLLDGPCPIVGRG